MKFYTYLFYGFYSIIQKTDYRDISAFGACMWMTVFSITYVIGIISKTQLQVLDHINSWTYVLILFIPMMIFNYLVLLKDKKYERLLSKYFKDENSSQKSLRITLTVLFALGAVLTLIKF